MIDGKEQSELSRLVLEWRVREGGGGKTERRFLDFIVDGQSIREQLDLDNVSCLGWYRAEHNTMAVQRLLKRKASDFANDRVSLYVCGECGDLGCGAVSIAIEREDDRIVWRDFGWQTDYDENIHFEDFEKVGPYFFDANEYYQAISAGLVTTDEQ